MKTFYAVVRIIIYALMVPFAYLALMKHLFGNYDHWPLAVAVTIAWLFLLREMYRKTGE